MSVWRASLYGLPISVTVKSNGLVVGVANAPTLYIYMCIYTFVFIPPPGAANTGRGHAPDGDAHYTISNSQHVDRIQTKRTYTENTQREAQPNLIEGSVAAALR